MNNTLENKIIRKLDDLGRIHIVKEIRQQVGVNEGDAMTIEVNEKDQIVLTKVLKKEKE